MAKNSIFDPTKDGVKADNSGYSSNQIDKMIGQSAAALIDDDAAGDDTVYSSAKIYSMLPEDTATGAEVTITDACPDLPIVELQADINAVQEGTGDPSPDNVRPISGWDKITVTHDGTDVEISLGDNTVYGGSLNVTTGELTIDHEYIILKDQTFSFIKAASANFDTFYLNVKTLFAGIKQTGYADFVCDKFNAVTSQNAGVNDAYIQTGWLNIRVTKDEYETAADFTNWVKENGLYIAYELATPTTTDLTPHQINTNGEGSTIISCDSGDVTVTYKKLTTLS